MTLPARIRYGARVRRGTAGTALAFLAVAALTASQAPGLGVAADRHGEGRNGDRGAAEGRPLPGDSPSDGAYHTELPPLISPDVSGTDRALTNRIEAESGIPATVLAAYKKAEKSVARTDKGCRLPWELLAAIGKVESGHARGGAVDARGTTRSPILGPVLDGSGFARIEDSNGGAYDGDPTYDRAVGPMQFIPATWAGWGADGNGDGKRDPDNVFDAALAAGHYLCAGDRDLSARAGLDRAVLSYNHSDEYLRTVRAWLAFYRTGTHAVPDGTGPLPTSAGPGSDNPKSAHRGGKDGRDRPNGKGGKNGGRKPGKGGIEVGPDPSSNPKPGPSGSPGDPDPGDTSSPGPTDPGGPGPSDPPSECPTDTASPTPTDTPTPSPTPSPTGSDDPCEDAA